MGRLPRIQIPHLTFHVVQRGHDRQRVFYGDDDYLAYLLLLNRIARRYETIVHAYVLMTNHVHLLMTSAQGDGISRTMQNLAGAFSRRVNERTERSGALWEGRFRSTPIDSEYYCLACYRYIELNPVRAGIVGQPAEYRWSSFHENTGRRALSIVTPHACFKALGTSAAERVIRYRALFDRHLTESTVSAIRNGTTKGTPIGPDGFVQNLERQLGISFGSRKPGRPRSRH